MRMAALIVGLVQKSNSIRKQQVRSSRIKPRKAVVLRMSIKSAELAIVVIGLRHACVCVHNHKRASKNRMEQKRRENE